MKSDNGRSGTPDIPALTGLRFLAASYVVLFHAWPVLMPNHPGPHYWNQFVSLGYVAVSLFFILSGYILVTVYFGNESSGTIDRGSFWRARFARIYPAYALSLLVSVPFAFRNVRNHSALYHSCKLAILTLSNGALLQAWHPALSGNWNRPTWSVSVEAFFYLVFPLVGSWAVRMKHHALVMASAFWLLSVAISLVWLDRLPTLSSSLPQMEILLFNPALRLPEFMVGIFFGLCAAKGYRLNAPYLIWLLFITYLLLVPALVKLPFLLVSNGLLSPLFGITILALATSTGFHVRLLSSRIMVRLGHASFSLYLFHLPLLFWMTFLVREGSLTHRLDSPWPLPQDSVGYLFSYLLACVVVSLLSYSYLESPARQMLKRWMAHPASSRPTFVCRVIPSELSRQA